MITAGAIVVPVSLSPIAQAQEQEQTDGAKAGLYVVQLVDLPIATYDGGVKGLRATKPGTGDKVDTDSASADKYSDYLVKQQNAALDEVGASPSDVVYRYDTALNGIAVELTANEALTIAKAPGVLNVWKNEIYTADTVSTPDYLGLTGDTGVWNETFGGPASAGEGMVVGVIDSGIWPENPSFAALPEATLPDTWAGECVNGLDPDAENNIECNNKLIGARYYNEGVDVADAEFESPRDLDGHGSHTASTAAGNNAVPMSVNGIDLGEGSGMAPAAQVATYKALWADGAGEASGATVDLVKAVEDAITDGVDVINYSVSGDTSSVVDPVTLAFLSAAAVGVVVSTSAGNSGDTEGPSSVNHNSPWTMTVAASTHDRNVNKTVTLGNDEEFVGVGVGPGVASAPLVYAGAIPASGVSADEAALCYADVDADTPGAQPSIDPELAAGAIVICDRGVTARVDKSLAVADADGVGMILANVSPAESVNGDFHSVPSIHVDSVTGDTIRDYATTTNPTASIGEPQTGAVVAPEMAGFSSYGPALAAGGDLLKPDITAPGVDVIAAVSPAAGGEDFNSLSGTSMSAPHIAGLAALLKQEHPDWSAAAIKSAMMTTARTTNSAGEPIQRLGEDATALDYGSGEVVPRSMENPGLVYDADADDWFGYACSINQIQPLLADPTGCDTYDTDASDLNYPTIAIGDLAGVQTVTRTVTNVTADAATYTADVSAPEGIAVSVNPSTISVPSGGKASYSVTFTQEDAPVGEYAFGSLTWEGPTAVTSAIAVKPDLVSAPDELSGTGASGSKDFSVIAGFSGELDVDVDGLVPADVVEVLATTGDTPKDGMATFEVPEGATALRASIFDDEVEAEDLDLYAYDPADRLVALSGQGGSDEEITLLEPTPGTWTIAVDVYSEEPTVSVPVNGFVVTDDAAGNFSVDPDQATVTPGQELDMLASWNDIDVPGRYFGSINYQSEGVTQGRTLFSIDNGTPAPPAVVNRVDGANRFEVAANIARIYPGPIETVYITNGYAVSDALSGAAPAAQTIVPDEFVDKNTAGKDAAGNAVANDDLGSPVLLTKANRLPAETVTALEELNPDEIIILGGRASVTDEVETALEAYGDVARIDGKNRYDLSANIAKIYNANVPVVYVASGADDKFGDALSGAALAGSQGAPVLLVDPDGIGESTQSALDYLDADQVIVLGGEATITPTLFEALGADRRLAGANRYTTSVAISQEFTAPAEGAFVASGRTWPDALTGSALAGFLGQPLMLSNTTKVPDEVMSALDMLSPAQLSILGGTATLTQDVEDQLNASYPAWAR